MTVDLCTVNYDTRTLLDRQIRSLIYNAPPPEDRIWKLHVADNGSQDDSRQYLEHCATPVNIVMNKNIGYALACNQLAALGEGEIIGLLNSDVWLSNADVEAIQDTFDLNPQIDVYGPKQRDEEGYITHGGIFGTNTAPKHRGWKELDIADEKYRAIEPAVTVSGSAYFIRRSTWEALMFDPEYIKVVKRLVTEGLVVSNALSYPGAFLPTRHYFEETHASYFANHRGFGVYYGGNVSIGHSWHKSHPVGSPQDQLFHESQFIFRTACDMLGIERD